MARTPSQRTKGAVDLLGGSIAKTKMKTETDLFGVRANVWDTLDWENMPIESDKDTWDLFEDTTPDLFQR